MAKEKKDYGPEDIGEDTEFELVALEAENIKALKVVKLGLKGKSLVVIGGNNAQGKTSLVDCIPIALGGKKYEPEEVIRRGESHGKIVLDLDEVSTPFADADGKFPAPIGLKVTVVFTKKAGRKLILEAKDGFPFRSPQEIFDRFVSKLTFDPLEFIRMEKEKQTEIVRTMAGIDFTQLDQEYQLLYDERRDLNRDVKNAEAVIKVELPSADVVPDEPVDISSLIAERDKIQEENNKNNERMKKVEQLKKDIEAKIKLDNEVVEEISRLEEKLKVIRGELHEMEDKYGDWSNRSKSLEWKKTDEIDVQISQAQGINALIEKKKLRDHQLGLMEVKKVKIAAMEQQMEEIKNQKAKILASAKYPVPGFKIDSDGTLLYNDLPFSQASGMQQIDVAIDMALAINPRLKLALVREGSIIDLDNLKRIHQRVEAKGGKLIMERTGKSGEMSVIIEEGEIVENRL